MSQALLEEIEKTPYGAKMLNSYKTEGITEGIAKGKTEGKAEDIIQVLTERLGTPSAKLQRQIKNVNNLNKLNELIRFSATCVSLNEFATAFN